MELCSTLRANLDGSGIWGKMNTCICMAESLHGSPETITTLLIGYISSVAQLCLILYNPMDWSTPGFPVHHQLTELAPTHVHWIGDPSNHLILCRPLLLLPLIFPSFKGFSNETVLRVRWWKYWSFSLNISPSNKYSGWFPLGWAGLISLLSKGLLKSLL